MRRPCLAAVVSMSGALVLFVSAAPAQQPPVPGRVPLAFPTDDVVLKRIWSVGMDSSRTSQLAQVLFDSIGPRLTGSPGMKAASDWVISQYNAWGIDARREEYGTWR
ncbi:MAG: hypothetical protein ACT4P7_21355, partial [Gemmatimonadaceae bacterium]